MQHVPLSRSPAAIALGAVTGAATTVLLLALAGRMGSPASDRRASQVTSSPSVVEHEDGGELRELRAGAESLRARLDALEAGSLPVPREPVDFLSSATFEGVATQLESRLAELEARMDALDTAERAVGSKDVIDERLRHDRSEVAIEAQVQELSRLLDLETFQVDVLRDLLAENHEHSLSRDQLTAILTPTQLQAFDARLGGND